MIRQDGRKENELRPIRMTPGFAGNAGGSVLIEWGRTRVLCTAMLEERAPSFRAGTGEGWLTAEYGMLPASTPARKPRDKGIPDGRSAEIRRLIGRALRTAVDFRALGERTIWIDCDVIEADGGTRTASVTGAYVALRLAARRWMAEGVLAENPVIGRVAAVSVGIVDDEARLDLPYGEDCRAQADMNVVMTGDGRFVEVQGTGERRPYTWEELNRLLELAKDGIGRLFALQQAVLGEDAP